MNEILEEYAEHLALERARSAHTQRAYLTDLRSLFLFVEDPHPGPPQGRDAADAAVMAGRPGGRRCGPHHPGAPDVSREDVARHGLAEKVSWTPTRRPGFSQAESETNRRRPEIRPGCHDRRRRGAEQDPPALRDRLIVELLYATGIRVVSFAD